MPKTATTCLQMHLFPRHSQIEYLGKVFESGPPGGTFPHPAVQALHAHVTGKGVAPRENRCRRRLARLIRPALAEGRVPLWSREGNTFGPPRLKQQQAGLLRRMLGPCKVVIFVRHPLKFIESMYFQVLKGFQMPKLGHKAVRTRIGEAPRYFDIQTWLDVIWGFPQKGPISHLRCADTADTYAAEFGRGNVRLLMFEHFVENPPEVIRSLCRFMGIDGDEAVALMDGKRENDRWTVEQIERLKAIERSPQESLRFRQGTWPDRQRMLGLDGPQKTSAAKARAPIPPVWQERILQFARQDHWRLADEWGLPLARYGYLEPGTERAA
jgi:hypothetical protein